jgi:hypothetical protein
VPFGVRQIRSVSHPQGTAGICLHCTYKNAVSLRFPQFSNTL